MFVKLEYEENSVQQPNEIDAGYFFEDDNENEVNDVELINMDMGADDGRYQPTFLTKLYLFFVRLKPNREPQKVMFANNSEKKKHLLVNINASNSLHRHFV